jgi:phosphatidylinositol-3-phosphatase
MRRLAALAVLAAAALVVGESAASTRPVPADLTGRFPEPARVAVLVLENRSYDEVIGSPDAPYLNDLARRYALATEYYAIGHPSLPNYVALLGGSTFDVHGDCNACDIAARSLVAQLDGAHISWKAYFEDLTSSARPGVRTRLYDPHYNPFVYYESVRDSSFGRSRVVDFDELRSDLRRGRLPRFSWIAPGVRHDGHDGSLREADRYASVLVPRILRALGPHGVLYVTWDEGARTDRSGVDGEPGGGHVALIAAGGLARRGAVTAVEANHYALLRTIEAGFDLPALGRAASPATPVLTGLLRG